MSAVAMDSLITQDGEENDFLFTPTEENRGVWIRVHDVAIHIFTDGQTVDVELCRAGKEDDPELARASCSAR